jgi:hypothetical protein
MAAPWITLAAMAALAFGYVVMPIMAVAQCSLWPDGAGCEQRCAAQP